MEAIAEKADAHFRNNAYAPRKPLPQYRPSRYSLKGHWASNRVEQPKELSIEVPMDKAYNPADVHPIYMKAFNAGDIEAAVACYESDGCFVSASGRIARGATELREVYRITFAHRPTFQVDVRKVLPAGDDLALIIGEWTSRAQTSSGETKVWSGTYTDIVRRQPDGSWKLVLDNSHGVEPSKQQSA